MKRFSPTLERLETRELPAVSFGGNLLTVTGDSAQPEEIRLVRRATGPAAVEVRINGQLQDTRELSTILRIDVHGGAGNDTLIIDSTNGAIDTDSLTAYENYYDVCFDGGDGTNRLVFQGGTAGGAEHFPGDPGSGWTMHFFGGTQYQFSAVSQKVLYSDVSSTDGVTDLVTSPSLRVQGSAGRDVIRLDNGTADNDGLLRVQTSSYVTAQFGSVPINLLVQVGSLQFANKTHLVLDGDHGVWIEPESGLFSEGAADTLVLAATEPAVGLTGVSVNGVLGLDTIQVEALASPTTINGGAAEDLILLGRPATGGRILDRISAPLTVVNSVQNLDFDNPIGADRLVLDGSADPTARTGWMTASAVTGLGMAGLVSYSGVGTVEVTLGAGADTFAVYATAAGIETTVNGGAGNDTLTVGNPTVTAAGSTVNAIAGPLTIDGGTGANDTLTVDDRGDGADNTGMLNVGSLTGLGMTARLTFRNLDTLFVRLGRGDDTLQVLGTAAGVSTGVDLGAGNDSVAVGRPTVGGSTLALMAGALAINGGGGTDDVLFDHSAVVVSWAVSSFRQQWPGLNLLGVETAALLRWDGLFNVLAQFGK